jgi:hypothetical protein
MSNKKAWEEALHQGNVNKCCVRYFLVFLVVETGLQFGTFTPDTFFSVCPL